ncbi:hypothetical protein KAZ93_04185 [Patescibacteria group bacterium]|nr:hypothetical protein [Patescibacteria group bacterium]
MLIGSVATHESIVRPLIPTAVHGCSQDNPLSSSGEQQADERPIPISRRQQGS